MQQENIQWYKNAIYEEMVEYHVTKYAQYNKGESKYCDAKIIIKHKSLSRYVDGLKKKVPNMSYSDFISECAVIIFNAINKFNHDDIEGIYDGSNKKAYNQLVKYIKSTLRFELLQHSHPNSVSTTAVVKDENGKKHSVRMYINAIVDSTDELVTSNDGGSDSATTLLETCGADSNYLSEKEGYEFNAFKSYFNENKERILKKSQLDLLETLEAHNYSTDDKKTRELAEAGVDVKSLASKLRRIESKVATSYAKEKKYYGLSFNERMIQKRIGLLRTMLSIINSDDVENMNERFSRAVIGNIDAAVMEEILDNLTTDEYKEVVFAATHKLPIISEVLYKLVVLMEAELERLEIALVKEQSMKEELAEKEGVVVNKEFIVPKNVSTIYVTVTNSGAIVNPKWEGMEQD